MAAQSIPVSRLSHVYTIQSQFPTTLFQLHSADHKHVVLIMLETFIDYSAFALSLTSSVMVMVKFVIAGSLLFRVKSQGADSSLPFLYRHHEGR
jgi:hypothetical protein